MCKMLQRNAQRVIRKTAREVWAWIRLIAREPCI